MSTSKQNGKEAADRQESDTSPIIDDLIIRARTLLSELELFHDRLRSLRQDNHVELAHFRSTLQSELHMLQRLNDKPDDDVTRHVARSSNLPFLETIWNTAKASKDVVSLQKRIYTSPLKSAKSLTQGMRRVNLDGGTSVGVNGSGKAAVAVDAITDAGRTWIKVSHVTNSRLLFDLAKQGWNSGGSDYDEEDEGNGTQPLDDEDCDVPLLRTAKDLTSAAKCFRVRTKTPQIHLILPRIQSGEQAEVDAILDACRATGAILLLGEPDQPIPPLEAALVTMAPDPLASFSPVLNIDCTILLALVSEFSHAKVSKQPWFHTALQRQVEIEDNENLLPSLLYPAIGSHELVCTREAVTRMREIVATIGTPSEKARTAIMLGDDKTKSRDELLDEMQDWSAYAVPRSWRLPIRAVDQDENGCQRNLPRQVLEVSRGMTAINCSVFLHGWAMRRTTITSNRTVVKQLEADLDQFEDLDDEEVCPRIWLCPTARSLVGKEKRGSKRATLESKAAPVDSNGAPVGRKGGAGAWPLPDPLRREQQRRNGLDVLALRRGHEVEDRRPEGYNYSEVLAAKNASQRWMTPAGLLDAVSGKP